MLLTLAILTVSAGIPFFWVERRWRGRWREIEVGRERVHAGEAGAYREGAATVPVFRREAPLLVRVAAFASLFFGQLFVPGLFVGALGLLAGGIGIVLAPGLVANAKLYLAGLTLLRREPRTAWFRAHNAANWTLCVNGVLAFVLAFAWWLVPISRPALFWWGGYLALSSLPAVLLRLAAARNEDALFLPTTGLADRALVVPGERLADERAA